jgi:hypothetical protein
MSIVSKYHYRQAEYPAARCPVRYTAGSHLSTNYPPVGLSLPLDYGVSSEFSVRRHVSLGVWKGDIAVHGQHHAGASELSQTCGKEAGQCSC